MGYRKVYIAVWCDSEEEAAKVQKVAEDLSATFKLTAKDLVWLHPIIKKNGIAFVIYLIAGNAEVNRGPFDLPEAESELTAGYHTEYSGMHFGLFYVAEFVNLFIIAGVAATIFLGGWMPLHIPGLDGFNTVMDYIPGFVWFFGKAFFVVWILMWFKWTFHWIIIC